MKVYVPTFEWSYEANVDYTYHTTLLGYPNNTLALRQSINICYSRAANGRSKRIWTSANSHRTTQLNFQCRSNTPTPWQTITKFISFNKEITNVGLSTVESISNDWLMNKKHQKQSVRSIKSVKFLISFLPNAQILKTKVYFCPFPFSSKYSRCFECTFRTGNGDYKWSITANFAEAHPVSLKPDNC